jgi:hypothetical protein
MKSIPFRERFSATIDASCKGTGIGRTTLYRLINEGRVETRKIGTRTLVLIPSLLAAIDPELAGRHSAGAEAP